jgi:hypothetical protein
MNKRTFSQLAQSFVKIDADRDAVMHESIVLFGDAPSYEAYMAARTEIIAGYLLAKPAASQDARDKFFSRFIAAVKSYAVENDYVTTWPEKPKAETPAAIKKAAERALPEALKNAKTVADLQAVPLPDDALEAAKLQKAIAETALRMVKLETDAATKAAKEATKARRDALVKYVKECDALALAELEAMRDHQTEIVLAALPLEEIEAATKALKKKGPAKTKAPAAV